MQVEDDHRNLKQVYGDPLTEPLSINKYGYRRCGLLFLAVLIVLLFIATVLQVQAQHACKHGYYIAVMYSCYYSIIICIIHNRA
jgi:hypothetical protein